MKKTLALVSAILTAITSQANTKEVSGKVFKHQSGYQFSYPNDWYLSSEDEIADDGKAVSVEGAKSIVVRINNDKRQACKSEYDCLLSVVGLGDGTDKGYKKAINYINKFRKFDRSPNAPKIRVNSRTLNGNSIDIIARGLESENFGISVYIYCKQAKRLFMLGSRTNRAAKGEAVNNLHVNLLPEHLFNPEQLLIINSFKCPGALVKAVEKKR